MKILIVEDDKTIREGIADFLNEMDYTVIVSETAENAFKIFEQDNIKLIVLDIMLPGMSGIEFLSKIRKISKVPVIILTGLSDEQTQVKSFDELADDYLTKPFSLTVLQKRIETQLRHYYGDKKYWKYEKAAVDFEGHQAYYDDIAVKLTAKEFKLLEVLIENKGITLSREKILDKVWTFDDEEPYERVIDVYVKNLRKKLQLDCIKTVKGAGYKMENL